ncbi:MAG: hypothetical protein ACFFB6_09755 [Promethearchaeota archaeon]
MKNRLADLEIKAEERDYCKGHLQEVLGSLKAKAKIESTIQNEEVFYLVP